MRKQQLRVALGLGIVLSIGMITVSWGHAEKLTAQATSSEAGRME